MKRIQWLYVLGNRDIQPKDRVCSVHFRSGRPSSDPSHEDFVPHLYLNNEPPPEVLRYLESLAETKLERAAPYESPHPDQERHMDLPPDDHTAYSDGVDMIPPRPVLPPKTRPSILQRRRKVPINREPPPPSALIGETTKEELISPPPTPIVFSAPMSADDTDVEIPKPMKRIKLQILEKPLVEAAGVRAGQTIIIKKRYVRKATVTAASSASPF